MGDRVRAVVLSQEDYTRFSLSTAELEEQPGDMLRDKVTMVWTNRIVVQCICLLLGKPDHHPPHLAHSFCRPAGIHRHLLAEHRCLPNAGEGV